MSATLERAHGALYGLAIGDALGMPTQLLPRELVHRRFPYLDGFLPGPPENATSHDHPAARVTDDTEQMVIVAELLLAGDGHLDVRRFVERLLDWARATEANGGEQLGRSSRRALAAIQRGEALEEAGRRGDTNGGAMRNTPVGIITPPEPLAALIDRVEKVCRPTHFTAMAIAIAIAIAGAAAVGAGIEGASFAEGLSLARAAANIGQQRGACAPGSRRAERIVWAVDVVGGLDETTACDAVADLVGMCVVTQESVPAAFAIASRWARDPWQACLVAARLGGDNDTGGPSRARCWVHLWVSRHFQRRRLPRSSTLTGSTWHIWPGGT
ncbi:MAG TPA: ADP-ribosylglycohydrolase family protein [Ktedonobacterales bacterium]|nr:ADP-ribosylglycohydrolase family protein [Ktedonobacterales bacterium]